MMQGFVSYYHIVRSKRSFATAKINFSEIK